MITEDQIAAATMAQLFGSELLRVDTTTLDRPGSISSATQLDPKRFLLNQHYGQQNQSVREAQLLEAIYREAEMSCPLPQQPVQQPQQQPIQQQPLQPSQQNISEQNLQSAVAQNDVRVQTIHKPTEQKKESLEIPDLNKLTKTLVNISENIERIANALEGVEIKKKKSTLIKRS